MSYGIQVETWGRYALFSRPELKTERMSYEVITPSAARGLIESIYWHPGIRLFIDRIHVLNEIRFTSVRRNEVKSKIPSSNIRKMMEGGEMPYIITGDEIVQRAAMVLRDVHYVIDAHFEMTERASESDNEGKFKDIFQRRLDKGQCYSQPYFGTREFPANFRAWKGGPVPTPDINKDLGIMLYDMDYEDRGKINPCFFHAVLKHGVVQVAGEKVYR